MYSLLWLTLGVLGVLANTETVLFEHKYTSPENHPSILPFEPFFHTFSFDNELVNHLKLSIPQEGKYFARICWPASYPAEFNIEYSDGLLVVTGSKSDVVPLRQSLATEVPFRVHLSPLKLGIPADVFRMVYGVVISIGFAGSFAFFVLKLL